MKIAMVVPAFPKPSETFIVSKFLGLLRRGHDVRVICQRFDRQALAFYPELGNRSDLDRRVNVRWPTEPRWRAALSAPFALAKAAALGWRGFCRYLGRGWRKFGAGVIKQCYFDAALIECDAEVVHFEFGGLAPGRLEQASWLGAKTVVSFRGSDLMITGLDQHYFHGETWEHADAVHFRSEGLRTQARRLGCPPGKPHRVIAPGINTRFFQPARREPYGILGTRHRPVLLVSVGRLDWVKGYEYALQAVERLRNLGVNVEYRIAGGGGYRDALEFARREMGLEDTVTFLGELRPEATRDALQWADVFLHTAVSEGFSNAVLEAQAMELPVVTSDAGGLPENVADGLTGQVVPRRDAVVLADEILRLAVQPELRRNMGQAARCRVLSEFDFEKQLDEFEKLYDAVLSSEQVASREPMAAALGIKHSPAG